MSTSNSNMGSMSGMADTLFSSKSTSLYLIKWTPSTTRQRAGTCIFFIVLAAVFRAPLSYRTIQGHRWRAIDLKRAPVIVPGDKDIGAGNGRGASRRWRISTDMPRASLDTRTVIAGLSTMIFAISPRGTRAHSHVLTFLKLAVYQSKGNEERLNILSTHITIPLPLATTY